MKNSKYILIALVLVCFSFFNMNNIIAANLPSSSSEKIKNNVENSTKYMLKKSGKAASTKSVVNVAQVNNAEKPKTYFYIPVKSLDLVNNPNAYLHKRVRLSAKFDKFSSLGLDYKPAFRSSDKYITFLIRRDDCSNDVPLSELKNIMKREIAEKYIDLETDDVIEYSGLVFSNALGDVWLDVENFRIVSSKQKKDTASAAENSSEKAK